MREMKGPGQPCARDEVFLPQLFYHNITFLTFLTFLKKVRNVRNVRNVMLRVAVVVKYDYISYISYISHISTLGGPASNVRDDVHMTSAVRGRRVANF